MNRNLCTHKRARGSIRAALAAALAAAGFAGAAIAADGDRYVHREGHYTHHAPVVRYHAAPRYAYRNYNYPRGYYGYRYHDPYYAYGPPPVVYDPAPSPGISLFFGF